MMGISTETVLLYVAAGISVLTVGIGAITVLMTWWNCRIASRKEAIRERLQEQLFSELFKPDPDWEALSTDLSSAEHEQLQQLIEAHLRRLRGTEYDRLRTLGRKLGMQGEAKDALTTTRSRFRGLTWLALFGEPVEKTRLKDCCTESRWERAGAARLLFESEQPNSAEMGTELLLWNGERPLTAFGMDTLYRLNNGANTPLLSEIPTNLVSLNTQLLVQVLAVLRYCSISEPAEQLGWLVNLLDHESPQVRAATVGVIERHGWREPFQRQIDIPALLGDPEPIVRYDVYQLLASWGSDQSAVWLQAGLNAEDDRELLAVVRALSRHPRASLPESNERLEPFLNWVKAEATVDQRRERVWGVSAAWA